MHQTKPGHVRCMPRVVKFLPVWEVSTHSGSYVVNLLDPNGKSDSYKMELELNYGFWNFNFF